MKKAHLKPGNAERSATKRGRPMKYTPVLAASICDRLAEGTSLRAVCRDPGMPSEAAVRLWVRDDVAGFATQYARARDIALDTLADEVLEIADAGGNDTMRDRLRFDARRWYLCKLAPKKYGDRQQVELAGALELRNKSDEELDAEIAALTAKLNSEA